MNKVALVTGASRGIGAATAIELAKHHYTVVVNYHESTSKAAEIVAQIKKNNGQAYPLQADIANEAQVMAMFKKIETEIGPIHALVNNAGINGGVCKVEDITAQHLQTVFATNVFATFYTCREALKRMKQQGGGSIVNVSSEAARFGGTKLSHYAAAKSAINTFTIAFAREAAADNVRVNAVSPGVIATDIHADSSSERLQALMMSLPFKRMGEAAEVAQLIAWLLSDAASYVSGAIVPISGAR